MQDHTFDELREALGAQQGEGFEEKLKNMLNQKPVDPDWADEMKMTEAKFRRIHRYLFGKKPRLPRKLKKDARHSEFEVFNLQTKTDMLSDPNSVNFTIEYDLRNRITPTGYPRTRSVQRLEKLFHLIMNRQHRMLLNHLLHQQYLKQHPGMLTYDTDTLDPSPKAKAMVQRGEVTLDTFHGHEMVLSRGQQSRLANMLNQNNEKE